MSAAGMYTLDDDGQPVPCCDAFEWGRWMQSSNRHVAETVIAGIRVSTVFLGLDHNFSWGGAPVLWESMVFGGPMDRAQARYTSLIEAQRGHLELVAAVKACLQ